MRLERHRGGWNLVRTGGWGHRLDLVAAGTGASRLKAAATFHVLMGFQIPNVRFVGFLSVFMFLLLAHNRGPFA